MVGDRAGYDALGCSPALIYNKNPPKRIAVSSGPNNKNQCAGNVPRHEPDDLPHHLPPFYASVSDFPSPTSTVAAVVAFAFPLPMPVFLAESGDRYLEESTCRTIGFDVHIGPASCCCRCY